MVYLSPVAESVAAGKTYWQYLESYGVRLTREQARVINDRIEHTAWEEPQTANDYNQVAVLALIAAEYHNSLIRDVTSAAVLQGLGDYATEHPLCAAHLALLHCLMGNTELATELAFSGLINILQPAFSGNSHWPIGLVYLPPTARNDQQLRLERMLNADTGATQALLLLVEVLQRSQPVFYSPIGQRWLNLAVQVCPEDAELHLKLGIAHLVNGGWDGLVSLHKAQQLSPTQPQILQALYLAYRDLGQLDTANLWLETARDLNPKLTALDWQWVNLPIGNPVTRVPFNGYSLAVEGSFRSIVTGVLIAQGDWFEREMEFWRRRLKPGMTVIDVGANVGVYTFAAAERVGKTGRVIAIEPFSGAVDCLQQTCWLNGFSQMTLRSGAASDRSGSAKLGLKSASELNELLIDTQTDTQTDAKADPHSTLQTASETVDCFTLDSLIESESLEQVDFLKIDAEGHELQVLKGSDRILKEYKPVILYENIAGSRGSNIPVAEYLQSQGYQLFRYRPYLDDLLPIVSLDDLAGVLNIVASPGKETQQTIATN